MALTPQEVLDQSNAAFRQWDPTWTKHCEFNGEIYKRNGWTFKNLLFSGAGKSLLCIATGPSLEKNIELVKEHKDNPGLDIICVDKSMGMLIDHDIIPKYVVIADAIIDYDAWCKPWEEYTDDIILIANINCNTDWTKNWKGKIYFYVNKDNIESEKKYSAISGCNDLIMASSNVGNTVVVFATQVLGYDEYLLLGYDYCWGEKENYYAFNDGDKRYWMKHADMIDVNGELVNTSQNLIFSSRWLNDFYAGIIMTNNLKVFNCSGSGILNIPFVNCKNKLEKVRKRKLNDREKEIIFKNRTEKIEIDAKGGQEAFNEAIKNHNIVSVVINHVPSEVLEWLN